MIVHHLITKNITFQLFLKNDNFSCINAHRVVVIVEGISIEYKNDKLYKIEETNHNSENEINISKNNKIFIFHNQLRNYSNELFKIKVIGSVNKRKKMVLCNTENQLEKRKFSITGLLKRYIPTVFDLSYIRKLNWQFELSEKYKFMIIDSLNEVFAEKNEIIKQILNFHKLIDD